MYCLPDSVQSHAATGPVMPKIRSEKCAIACQQSAYSCIKMSTLPYAAANSLQIGSMPMHSSTHQPMAPFLSSQALIMNVLTAAAWAASQMIGPPSQPMLQKVCSHETCVAQSAHPSLLACRIRCPLQLRLKAATLLLHAAMDAMLLPMEHGHLEAKNCPATSFSPPQCILRCAGLSMAAAVSTLAGPSALPRRLAHQHSSDSHASFGSFEGGTPREQGMASSPVQKLAAPCSRDPFGLASLDQVSPLHEPVNGTGADAAARHAPERWAGSAEAGTECQLSGMHSRRGKAGHEAVSCPPAPVDRERRGIAGADIFESLSSLSFGEGRATWHGSSRTRRVPEQIAPTNPAHTLQLPVSQNSGYRERQRTPYAMAGAGLESI